MRKIYAKILSTAVIATMIMPMTAAYAEGRGQSQRQRVNPVKLVSSMEQNKENQEHSQGISAEIQATIAQLRQAINTNRTTMLANIRKIHQLKMQVIQKKQTINSLIEYLLNNKNAVTNEELAQINAQNVVIKADVQSINSSRGTIGNEDQNIALKVKNKDIQGVANGITYVIEKQQSRINELTKLSSDLDTMINILQNTKSAIEAAASTTQSGTAATASASDNQTAGQTNEQTETNN